MKILTVRGENLASLEGPFEVAFAEGPLADAGVFAITGPTGAGKSTLLDAICLALFDEVPRLAGRGQGRFGAAGEDAERLTVTDTRGLLRRGAGSGFAEVDFLGADGRRYRARWQTRRARQNPGGRLQASELSLHDLDADERIGEKKTEVKPEIERRLGLSFAQFRRSVLLAQGEFAAFLDADPRERAELLERMTGTDVYGKISRAAHRKLSEKRAALAALGEESEAEAPLEAEPREALEAALEDAAAAKLRAQASLSDAEKTLRWHDRLEHLRAEEQAARESHEKHGREREIWEQHRKSIAAFERALPLAPRLAALREASRERGARAEAKARAAEALKAAEVTLERERGAEARAREALSRLEEAWDRALPLFERGRALTQNLALARETLASRERELEARQEEVARARAEAATQLGLRAKEEVKRVEAIAWLEAHPEAATLEAERSRVEARLAAWEEGAKALAEAQTRRAAAEEALEAAEAKRKAATGAHRVARAALAEAEATLEAAEASHRAVDAEALDEDHDRAHAEREAWASLAAIARAASEAREAAVEAAARGAAARGEATRAVEEGREREAERHTTSLRLKDAERVRERLRATRDLEAHRAELVEGEPCPLCGAREHPYAEETPFDGLIDTQDAEVAELRGALRALEARIDELAAHCERAKRDTALADEALSAARARQLDAEASFEEERAALGEALLAAMRSTLGRELEPTATDAEHLEAAAAEAKERERALAEAQRAARARERALAKIRAETEAKRREERALAETLRDAREAHELARSERVLASEALAAQRRERATLRAELEPAMRPLAGAEWEAIGAEELGRWVRDRVAEHAAQVRERRLASEALEAIGRELARAEERVEQRGARERDAREALEAAKLDARAREEACAAHDARLREALGPLATAEEAKSPEGIFDADLEARARATRAKARAEAEAALERVKVATERRDATNRASSEADALAAKSAADEARLRAELETALAEVELEEAEAIELLERDREALEALRQELSDYDRRGVELQTRAKDCADRRSAYEAEDPPALDAEAAKRAVDEGTERARVADEALRALEVQRATDDERRRVRVDRAERRREAEEALKVWETLGKLIGSATGHTFRVFAQSLTLELLLDHANAHLADLAPRYGLERVPGEDLAVQVIDRDLGDIPRSLASLSGGETFLVALGLALGLASLDAERARVDSLFIDEGFGHLDPESLELVLATLDSLRATGRQVGIISHVPALAERFPVRVEVIPHGAARSRVALVAG